MQEVEIYYSWSNVDYRTSIRITKVFDIFGDPGRVNRDVTKKSWVYKLALEDEVVDCEWPLYEQVRCTRMRETRMKQLTHDTAFKASHQPSAMLDKEYDRPCISHFAFLGSRGKLSL